MTLQRWALTLGLLLHAAQAHAQREQVLVAANASRGPVDVRGHSVSVDWLTQREGGGMYGVGLSEALVGRSYYTTVRGMSAWRRSQRWVTTADAELGWGEQGGARFTYLSVQGSVIAVQGGGRTTLEAGLRYLDVAEESGALVRFAVATSAARFGVSATAIASQRSPGVRALVLRAQRPLGRVTPYAGLATGRSAPLLHGAGLQLGAEPMRDGFAGLSFPVGAVEAALHVDRLRLGDRVRRTAGLSARIPF